MRYGGVDEMVQSHEPRKTLVSLQMCVTACAGKQAYQSRRKKRPEAVSEGCNPFLHLPIRVVCLLLLPCHPRLHRCGDREHAYISACLST